MELGHLLNRSGLTYPEVSSQVYHDSFCQLGTSVSLPWVSYYETFYLHVVSSFSCIPVTCPKLAKKLKSSLSYIYHGVDHLLIRSGHTYPEVSSKVCHDSFCQLGNSVSLPWVIYYGAFYLHVVSSFSCIPVTCPKLAKKLKSSSSSSSSYICHGVEPLVDPFRSHVSRSLFKGLP